MCTRVGRTSKTWMEKQTICEGLKWEEVGELHAPCTSTQFGRFGNRFLLHPAPAIWLLLTRGKPSGIQPKKVERMTSACFLSFSNKKIPARQAFPSCSLLSTGELCVFLLSGVKTKVNQKLNRKGTQLLLQFFKYTYTHAAEFRIVDVSVCQEGYMYVHVGMFAFVFQKWLLQLAVLNSYYHIFFYG